MTKTIEQEYEEFERRYPRFEKPQRQEIEKILVPSDSVRWEGTLTEFVKYLQEVQDNFSDYTVLKFKNDGSCSYDGIFYDIVGIRLQNDVEYEASCRSAAEKYVREKAKARDKIANGVFSDFEIYNQIAERHGWPTKDSL